MEPLHEASPNTWGLHRKHPVLIALAVEAFGNETAALNWFYSVHPPWGLLPAYVARTPEGMARVSAELAAILAAKRAL